MIRTSSLMIKTDRGAIVGSNFMDSVQVGPAASSPFTYATGILSPSQIQRPEFHPPIAFSIPSDDVSMILPPPDSFWHGPRWLWSHIAHSQWVTTPPDDFSCQVPFWSGPRWLLEWTVYFDSVLGTFLTPPDRFSWKLRLSQSFITVDFLLKEVSFIKI